MMTGPDTRLDKGVVRTPPEPWLHPDEAVRCAWPGRSPDPPPADPYDYGFDEMPV